MSSTNHSLRVALIYRGTVYRERTFTRTSEPVVTVGGNDTNAFVTPADGVGDAFEMFERTETGYRLRFTGQMEGSLHRSGETSEFGELADGEAVEVDAILTDEGSASVYEITCERGDWGLVRLGDHAVFFQLLGQPEVAAGRGLSDLDVPVLGSVGGAAVAHLAFLLVCFLAFDVAPELQARTIPDRFVQASVDDVDEPIDKKKDDEPEPEPAGKKAGGEEGKFGEEDADREESDIPDVDGPMEKRIDVENLGVNKMLSENAIGKGPLKNIFNDQDGFDSKMKVAMSGDADGVELGRGSGGLGMRGDESGGGGDGFGGVHKIGGVESGGQGPEAAAQLEDPDEREIRRTVDPGSPDTGDFCEPEDIQRVVSRKSAAIQHCYEGQLQTNPDLEGKIIAHWKVGLDGAVTSTSIAESSVGNAEVESCLLRVIERMRFEKPDGGICVIEFPFVFQGGQ